MKSDVAKIREINFPINAKAGLRLGLGTSISPLVAGTYFVFNNSSHASGTMVAKFLFCLQHWCFIFVDSLYDANPLLAATRRSFASESVVLLVQGDDSNNITPLNMVSCAAEPRRPYSETTRTQYKNLLMPRTKLVQQ